MHTLFDLCLVFGRANPALTRRLMDSVFRCQPSYFDDLFDALSLAVRALTELGSNIHGAESIKHTRAELHSVLAYLQDLVRSLLALLEMLPAAADACEDAKLLRALVTCYEVTIPLLQHQLELLNSASGASAGNKDDKSFQSKASGMAVLRDVRLNIVKLAHILIRTRYVQPIADAASSSAAAAADGKRNAPAAATAAKASADEQPPKDLRGATEKFANMLTDVAKAATDASKGVSLKVVGKIRALSFLRHYNRLYKLDRLLRALVQQKNPLGEARLSHLQLVVQEAMTRGTNKRASKPSAAASAGTDASRAEPFNASSLIAQLRSVFADFSDDFARACLRESAWSVDRTMAAILDGRLPDKLQSVKDRKRYREGGALPNVEPEPIAMTRQPSGAKKPATPGAASGLAMDFSALSLGGLGGDKRARDDDSVSVASENLLNDDDNDDEEFQRFLNRTGRVKKDDAVRERKSQLSVFDKDEHETEVRGIARVARAATNLCVVTEFASAQMLKENIVKYFDQYDDERNDACAQRSCSSLFLECDLPCRR